MKFWKWLVLQHSFSLKGCKPFPSALSRFCMKSRIVVCISITGCLMGLTNDYRFSTVCSKSLTNYRLYNWYGTVQWKSMDVSLVFINCLVTFCDLTNMVPEKHGMIKVFAFYGWARIRCSIEFMNRHMGAFSNQHAKYINISVSLKNKYCFDFIDLSWLWI